jgi:hypothetical protein
MTASALGVIPFKNNRCLAATSTKMKLIVYNMVAFILICGDCVSVSFVYSQQVDSFRTWVCASLHCFGQKDGQMHLLLWLCDSTAMQG